MLRSGSSRPARYILHGFQVLSRNPYPDVAIPAMIGALRPVIVAVTDTFAIQMIA